MRFFIIAFVASVLLALPAASASAIPSPVVVVVEPTTPSEDCGDCVGLRAGAGVGIPNCFDCSAYGALVGVEHEEGETTASARACYSSFFYACFVDESVTV